MFCILFCSLLGNSRGRLLLSLALNQNFQEKIRDARKIKQKAKVKDTDNTDVDYIPNFSEDSHSSSDADNDVPSSHSQQNSAVVANKSSDSSDNEPLSKKIRILSDITVSPPPMSESNTVNEVWNYMNSIVYAMTTDAINISESNSSVGSLENRVGLLDCTPKIGMENYIYSIVIETLTNAFE